MPTARIYLDHAASAPLTEAARAAWLEGMALPGNPSSPHAEGRAARDRLEAARSQVASALGCRPREVLFTGSGTEASQLALRGLAHARPTAPRRVVVSAVEHAAILEGAAALGEEGFEVAHVPPAEDGSIASEAFLDAVGDGAAVAALVLAHHETGALMPVAEVAAALAARDVPLVSDACLAPGRVGCTRPDVDVDALVLSGHKVGGPRGVGCLVLRRGRRLAPLYTGGLQEERLRPGTEAVGAAAGFAAALAEAVAQTDDRSARYRALDERLLAGLEGLERWRRLGPATPRLPGLTTLELEGVEGEAAMINLDLAGFAVATGSTCSLGAAEPSPALLAMGLSRQRAASTLRISFGEGTADDDVDGVASTIVDVVERLRSLARR